MGFEAHLKDILKHLKTIISTFIIESGAEFVEQFPFLFRPLSIIYIYFAAEPEDCKEDGCYYSVVDEKAFMEKMKEWHVELEDNKPEEIPPWKEQI